jgi:excisionase family DNA binding protein
MARISEPLGSQTFLPPDDVGALLRVIAAFGPPERNKIIDRDTATTRLRPRESPDPGSDDAQAARPARLVAPDGGSVDLPPALFAVLLAVAQAMRAGRAVTVSPTSRQLTTQEAAELLGMSRPSLIRLLDLGEIPYERPGRHRRIRLDDILSYQERRRAERRAALDELTRSAREEGLYDMSAEDYAEALRQARHGDG